MYFRINLTNVQSVQDHFQHQVIYDRTSIYTLVNGHLSVRFVEKVLLKKLDLHLI